MLEISVKTLDGQTRKFEVPEDKTVAEFKETIADSLNIPAARQRVIFQGRLLNNESRLGDLDLNGRAVHVVERMPPAHPPEGQQQSSQNDAPRGRPDFIMAGSFEVPADIQQVVQQAVNQFGPAARGASVETRRMPGGGSGLEVHIRLPPPGASGGSASPQDRTAHEVNERIRVANKMLNLANHVVSSLESNPQASTSNNSENPNTSGATAAQVPPQEADMGLANVLTNITRFNDRLKPILEEFNERVLNRGSNVPDEASHQRTTRLAQTVPEILHHVSHALHNISDLVIEPLALSQSQSPENSNVQNASSQTRFSISSSTITPVHQGIGVYQQVFSVPVVEVHGGHPPQQPQQQQHNTQSQQQSGNQAPFVRAPLFNPFNLGGFFPRPPVATVITNTRPQGVQPNTSGENNSTNNTNGMPQNMVRPIDQNLPCLSRHFLAPHVIEAARLSSQNAASAAAASSQQPQQTGAQHPPIDPANMMNMFQDITNFVMQAIVQAGSQGNPQHQQQQQHQQHPQPGGLPPQFMASMQQLANNVPANEPFAQIINSLGQIFADPSGAASRTSAYDFIQGLGNVPAMQPSPVNNLIEVIMRALPMSDFIALIMGDISPLARVHGPLRQHFVSQMEATSSQNVSVVVDPIVEELRTMYEFVFTEIQTSENIDVVASLISHDRSWLTQVVQLVVETPPSSGLVEANNAPLYRRVYDTIFMAAHEAVVLIITAIGSENARPTMRRLVQRAIANMDPGSPESQSAFIVATLSEFVNRLITQSPQRVPRSQIERFIVRRAVAASPIVAPIHPQASASQPPAIPSSIKPASNASSPDAGDVSWVQANAQNRARTNILMTNPASSSDQIPSGDWKSVVPADWAPIIEHDIRKQRVSENTAQPPFSDAYISGLPAKRRRIAMEQRSMDALAQGQLSRGFSDILSQASRASGVPAAIMPSMVEEAAASSELNQLFESEVIRHLRTRLASDPNFDPARYPEISNFMNARNSRSTDSSSQ